MTDREMLAAAADAAGIPTEWHSEAGCPMRLDRIGTVPWNPLVDDGDALRLAVALDISINLCAGAGSVMTSSGDIGVLREEGSGMPSVRRAIVRAAAAIAATPAA